MLLTREPASNPLTYTTVFLHAAPGGGKVFPICPRLSTPDFHCINYAGRKRTRYTLYEGMETEKPEKIMPRMAAAVGR